MSRSITSMLVVAATLLAGCGIEQDDSEPVVSVAGETTIDQFPEILDVDATYDAGDETWSFDVTVASPYDTPERYADGWRVVGPDGAVYGVHTWTHDHAGEQPFTRRQSGVRIPDDIVEVTIEGRDLVNGFGGATLAVDLEAVRA
jgi:hypothetical protein